MAVRDYTAIKSQEDWKKILQDQAKATKPTGKTTAGAQTTSRAQGIYPVKTAGLLPALPGSTIKTQPKWEELLGQRLGNGGTLAQTGAQNAQKTQAAQTGGGLRLGTTAGSRDPYGGDLSRLYGEAMNQEYSSPYDDQAAALYAQIMGRQPYQSEYGGQIADLYGQLNGRGEYQSQYGDQIADLYGQLSGRGPYKSPYEEQIKNLYDTIVNRPKFSYDANKDPLYQQYREQYARGGQQAMRDTMGASAALTGGYGNSWGNTAGYQAYQNYMAALNDKIPELSQQAFDRYQQEGSDLQNQLALAQAMDNAGYSRWQDEGDALRQQLATVQAMDEAGYGRWQDEGDALRQRLSTALALDEDAYNRYQQAGDELRQNLNAANNLRESDWQRYLQQQGLLQDQIALAQQMRDNELQYQAASGELMAPYMEQLQALQMAAGLPAGAGAQTPAGSNFDAREYAASLAGIKAGQLKKDQSPITTLGGVKNSNNWYDQVYQAMDEAAQNKSTSSGKSGTGSTKTAGSGTGTTGAPQKKNWDDTPLSPTVKKFQQIFDEYNKKQ